MCSAVVQALKTFGPSSLRTFSASTMAGPPDSQPQETQVVYFVVKFQELFCLSTKLGSGASGLYLSQGNTREAAALI